MFGSNPVDMGEELQSAQLGFERNPDRGLLGSRDDGREAGKGGGKDEALVFYYPSLKDSSIEL